MAADTPVSAFSEHPGPNSGLARPCRASGAEDKISRLDLCLSE